MPRIVVRASPADRMKLACYHLRAALDNATQAMRRFAVVAEKAFPPEERELEAK